jgi:hypothetical protein
MYIIFQLVIPIGDTGGHGATRKKNWRPKKLAGNNGRMIFFEYVPGLQQLLSS